MSLYHIHNACQKWLGMLYLVLIGIQTLTNFPSSSVLMVFVSGVLGGVSRFSDVLLRSLVSQVI